MLVQRNHSHFNMVVIDEATQATEPATLVPLTQVCWGLEAAFAWPGHVMRVENLAWKLMVTLCYDPLPGQVPHPHDMAGGFMCLQ